MDHPVTLSSKELLFVAMMILRTNDKSTSYDLLCCPYVLSYYMDAKSVR